MFNAQRKWIVAITICTSLFIFGLAKLFWLRFEAGDLYPPYSSLRGDPLGAQVLYESIQRLQPEGARRNYRPLNQVTLTAEDTLLVLGLPVQGATLGHSAWNHVLDQVFNNGGRLVISFRGRAGDRRSARRSPDTEDDREDLQKQEDKAGDIDRVGPSSEAPVHDGTSSQDRNCWKDGDCDTWMDVWRTLGIELKPSEAQMLDDVAERTTLPSAVLPANIPWRSPFFFDLSNAAWQTIYRWEGKPAVVARSWGSGSIVMTGDSYLFSNEALRRDRFPDLLTWFIQPSRRVVLDESHNGLVMQPGIAHLMHKYRLQGLLISLGVLLLLLMWRQTTVFVPRPAEQEANDIQTAGDTVAGLVDLMQQHIRADDLLAVCYEAWRTSVAAARVPEDRLSQIQHILADFNAHKHRKDIVGVYKQIGEVLKQGKRS